MRGLWTRIALVAVAACALMSRADDAREVHVYQQTSAGGSVVALSDETLETGREYVTQTAPEIEGYIFTHWSIEPAQAINARDRQGRARDAAIYALYESVTLTANYLPEGEDTDADGVDDGRELYWYGDLSKDAASDTDGDGMTLAEEIAAGTNPLVPNESAGGGIVSAKGAKVQYNADGVASYTIRSEPEGLLFETITDFALPGTVVTTPAVNREGTSFTYWTCNGVRVADRHGRAVDSVTRTIGTESLELVAVCVEDEAERAQYYWYGAPTDMSSDTDGDGMTLAEEIAAGTNPLVANESVGGGLVSEKGTQVQYNRDGTPSYVIRSEPEGLLFETITAIVEPGTSVDLPSVDRANTTFAYWTRNGVRVADRHGRAADALSFVMPEEPVEYVAVCIEDEAERAQYYWYGALTDMSSDTDGDGMTLAEEIAAGTNPLVANESVGGGIVSDGGAKMESDLQVFEQSEGALVNGRYEPIFTSPIAGNGGTSWTFGANLTPYVFDFDGDGKFDLILRDDNGTRYFRNSGSKGAPAFTEAANVDLSGFDFDTNSVERLAAFALNVSPEGAVTATYGDADQDGLTDILVSDDTGRIWYYRGNRTIEQSEQSNNSYTLQHKIWGGTYNGFANGLRIAAVDWDDDGDLDMLCGTAEGKLMLLSDPRAGHPVNLQAQSGVSDVELTWSATGQSRVRGYYVYRSPAAAEDYTAVAETALPAHRDAPEELQPYDYRVTSVSRFYTAGNSEPTLIESPATDPVRVEFGKVRFIWRPAAGFVGDVVDVVLAAENAYGLAAESFQLKLVYDEAVLTPIEVKRSGLTENLRFSSTWSRGSWIVAGTGGEITAGTGAFLTFTFRVADAAALQSTSVRVEDFELGSVGGGNVIPDIVETAATVGLSHGAHPDPSYVPAGSLGDLDGDGRLTAADVALFVKWKDAAADAVPAEIVRAADYNGDGKLDNKDYHLMKRDFRDRENRGGTMGNLNFKSTKRKETVK